MDSARVEPVGAVVFDLDGTLIDSAADIARAANHCLALAGLPERSLAEICSFIGDGSRVLLARASRYAPDDARLDALLAQFVSYYSEHALDQTRLLPGARAVLDELAHVPLALCTNKPRATTGALLDGLGIAKDFAAVVAGGDVAQHKPHPAPLERVAALLGVPPSTLVMVGDGPQDVECARAVGARSIGISEALIVPLERLLASRPDRVVPLPSVPRVISEWGAPAPR